MSIATRIQSINEHIEDAYNSLNKMGVTANNKNIENIADLVNQIYENAPKTDYVSGVDLTIENTLKGKLSFKDTDSIEKIGFGNITQDGTPTPTSPIDVQVVRGNQNILIQNQNIMRINKTFPYTDRAVTYSYSNGQFNLSGTANNNNIYMMIYEPNGVPIFNSGDTITVKSETNWGYTSRVEFLKSDSKFLVGATKNSTQTITFEADCYGYRVWYDAQSSKNFSNIYQKIEIEKGTTTLSEYVTPQEKSYKINLSSKNLFNKNNSNLIFNGFINASTNKLQSNTNARTAFIPCKPNTIYTISKVLSGRFIIAETSSSNISTDISITILSTSASVVSHTITTSANAKYVLVFYYLSTADTLTEETIRNSVQMEVGSTATSYAPYFTPVELCQIGQYQDYIYKNNGNWFIHKEIGKIVLNGSENLILDGALTNTNRFRINITSYGLQPMDNQNTGLNNQFQMFNAYDNDSEHLYSYKSPSTGNIQLYMFYNKTRCADLNGLETWLNANNLIVYGLLATPAETQITDTTLISQLDAWYNAQSMNDITYITVDGDLPMQLKVKTLKK